MSAAVVYKHNALSDEDLQTYLADSIRSDAMLAMRDGLEMPGPFYRAVRNPAHEEWPITSWCGGRYFASLFGEHVKEHEGSLRVIAMLIHTDENGSWTEYVAVTP